VHPALDVLDNLAGGFLVPAPIEGFGRAAELDDEVAREVLWLDFSRFSCQRRRRAVSSLPNALLRWSAEDLARQSALGVTTIRRAELTEDETSLTAANDLSVRHALEAAGVIFIDEDDEGPGVRLRKRSKDRSRN
jgi:hypothetical protein